MGESFSAFAKWMARHLGRPQAFVGALAIIVAWALSGPLFGWSDTWQLIINTGTTIVTFLMVFLIQNTQNRDTEAIQTKLDELLRATKRARNEFIDIEDLPEAVVERMRKEFLKHQGQEHEKKRPAGR